MTDLPAALLWDMDGTLVDTEPYWIAAERELVAAHGGTWTDELAHQLVGNPLLVSADFIIANSPVDLEPVAVVEHLQASVIQQVKARVPWRPGARELLAQARAADVPCALVTMSWQPLAAAVVEALEPGTFARVVTGDQVSHGKPHPEPYLTACTSLGVRPADCIAIEDSGTGVRSAVAAGVPTVAVPNVVTIPPVVGAVQVEGLDGLGLAALTALAGTGLASGQSSAASTAPATEGSSAT